MSRKYSENFERDYKFYLENIKNFTFCGTLNPSHKAIPDKNGKTAKEAFFLIDSTGKNNPTCEPDLLNQLLLCKASVNFHIKQWAEGRAEGTLPFCEFAGKGETLEWETETIKHKYFWWLPVWLKKLFKIQDKVNPIPIYKKSIAAQYGLPNWAIKAVEMQKIRIIQSRQGLPDWFIQEAKNQKVKYSDKNFVF